MEVTPELVKEALDTNSYESLSQLITEWIKSPNKKHPFSNNTFDALLYAVTRSRGNAESIELIKLLLYARDGARNPIININAVDSDGRTALHHLLDNDRIDHHAKLSIFNLMMDLRDIKGNLLIDMTACKWSHGTPLMDAIRINHSQIVYALLDLRKRNGDYAIDIDEARSSPRHTALDVVYMHCLSDETGQQIEQAVRERGGQRYRDIEPDAVQQYRRQLGAGHPLHPDYNPRPSNRLPTRPNLIDKKRKKALSGVRESESIEMSKKSNCEVNMVGHGKIMDFVNNRQNTHEAQVTISGNASIRRLQKRYPKINIVAELKEVKAYIKKNGNCKKRDLVMHRFEAINNDYSLRDDVNLSLGEMLALAWVAIKDKTAVCPAQIEVTDKDVAMRKLSLFENLYRAQIEYGTRKGSNACFRGTFDKILESLDGSHPDVVLITAHDPKQIKQMAIANVEAIAREALMKLSLPQQGVILKNWDNDNKDCPAEVFRKELAGIVKKELQQQYSLLLPSAAIEEILICLPSLAKPIIDIDLYNLKNYINQIDCLVETPGVNKKSGIQTDIPYINKLGFQLQALARELIERDYDGTPEKTKKVYLELQEETIIYNLSVLLGDHRYGNPHRQKQDKFTESSLTELNKILNPLQRLQVLDSLFHFMVNTEKLYTRRNDKFTLFMMDVVDTPVSATYQKHVKLIKDKYVEIISENKGKADFTKLLNHAQSSKLLDENRSNYKAFQETVTTSRAKVNRL